MQRTARSGARYCILPLLNGIMESVSQSRLGFLHVGETDDLLGKECPSRTEMIYDRMIHIYTKKCELYYRDSDH